MENDSKEKDWCKVCRVKHYRKSKMKKYILDNLYPLDDVANTFIDDFELLHIYFSSGTSLSTPYRKIFKFLKEKVGLENIRTNIIKTTMDGILVEINYNKNKDEIILTIDDAIEYKFDSKEIDKFNPSPAPEILVSSLIRKYGKQKIEEAIKRMG